MRAAILAALRGDATLMASLPGGLYDAAEVGVISTQRTPAAWDANGELRPCGLLRLAGETPTGPFPTSAQVEVTLYLYQRACGEAHIEAARLRAYALLHRVRLAPASGGAWALRHTGDVTDVEDDALGASLSISRYRGYIRKAEVTS